jgi:hypothetical protein
MSAKPSFLQAAMTPTVSPAPISPFPSPAQSDSSTFTLSLATLQEIRETITSILTNLPATKQIPDSLKTIVNSIKPDLESLQQEGAPAPGFRRGLNTGRGGGQETGQPTRQFSPNQGDRTWGGRNGGAAGGGAQSGRGAASEQSGSWRRVPAAFSSSNSSAQHTPFGNSHNGTRQPPPFAQNREYSSGAGGTTSAPSAPRPPAGKYQSRFKRGGAIQDKILNSIIGNKLNTFSPVTYNDVRDFIYQILDSGETEFIRDFVEKVFDKATQEDIYCALFAKLLSEICSKYPMIRTEMEKYHTEFLRVFDTVQESKDVEYEILVRQKQYRMGYGQFMSDLAGLNTLDPAYLYAMVDKILDKIDLFTGEEDKAKTVEEFIDCYTRMMKALKQKNPVFFKSICNSLSAKTNPRIIPLIEKTAGARPSLSNKARFGLMDLQDILKP